VSDRYKEMWEDAFHDNLEKKAEISELKAENARLKAECQARQAENSVLAVECDSLKAEVERLTFVDLPKMVAWGRGLEHDKRLLEEEVEKLKAEVKKLTEAGNAMDNAISEIDPQRAERHRFMRMTDAEYVAVMKWRVAKDPNYNRA